MQDQDKKCTVAIGKNPNGSLADDTYYIYCWKDFFGYRAYWPMCEEHWEMFAPEKQLDEDS